MTTPAQACLSDLALDRVVAGAAPPSHLSGCARCKDRLALFQQLRERAAPDVARLVRVARARVEPPRAIWPWLPRLGPVFAVLAVVVTLVLRSPGDGGDGVRLKGNVLKLYRQRGAEVVRGASGDRFLPKDRLRFAVSSGTKGWFLLVGIEAPGSVTAYHPYQGTQSEPLPAGVETTLPGSLELDDAPGPEYFVGIFSAAPITLEQVRQAVARVANRPEPFPERGLELPGALHWVVVNKP